ncbi:caspase domain-containing protein [Streptomyces sp. NPDC057702]|uniref:caspase family protein n=1 Tax=unclassified Streptomyces TaxID=2593676 RepID=UPI0036B48E83
MTEPAGEFRALLIGNSEFSGPPDGPRPLLGPPTDVRALAAALTDPDTGLHGGGGVRTVLEGDTQHIKEELADFFEGARARQRLLLYYSGHGLLDLHNRLRLGARDTTHEHLRARSLELRYIDELIDDCAARSIVVILDCCFSGAAAVKGTDPAAQLAGHGRFVMTSSSHADTSADAAERGTTSPFTQHLVAGLRSGAPDRGGYVTAYDLYHYVHDRLRPSGQIPHVKTQAGVGAIPLARRTRRPAPSKPSHADERGRQDEQRPERQEAAEYVDIRPHLVGHHGSRTAMPAYTDFSGMVFVQLPPHGAGMLAVHRDEILAASEGTPVTAEVYRRATLSWRGAHSGVHGRKVADVRSELLGGGVVAFTLPTGQGVEWAAPQVRVFRQARERGRWPGTPLPPSRALLAELRADSGYRRLRRRGLRGAAYGLALVVATMLRYPLSGFLGLGEATCLALDALVLPSGIAAFASRRTTWRFIRVRAVLRGSGLYAVSMVMRTERLSEWSSDGIVGIELHPPWAWLAYPDAAHTPLLPQHGSTNASGVWQTSVGDWQSLAVKLDSAHGRYVDGRPGSAVERVEVIGTPAPGRWLVIRTPDGLLWPRNKAVLGYPGRDAPGPRLFRGQ